MLRTETNTRAMERRVLHAANQAGLAKRGRHQVDFEHGQWLVTNLDTGAQWSACDAQGSESSGVFAGFYFEQVTEGDES